MMTTQTPLKLTASLVAVFLGATTAGCPAPCTAELNAAELGIDQGIMGSVSATYPPPSTTCYDDVVEFILVNEEDRERPALTERYAEQRGETVAEAVEGVFARSLEPGLWYACHNNHFDDGGSGRVVCVLAEVDEGAVVDVWFNATDIGFSAKNRTTGDQDDTDFHVE